MRIFFYIVIVVMRFYEGFLCSGSGPIDYTPVYRPWFWLLVISFVVNVNRTDHSIIVLVWTVENESDRETFAPFLGSVEVGFRNIARKVSRRHFVSL